MKKKASSIALIALGIIAIIVGIYMNSYAPEGKVRATAEVTEIKQITRSIILNKYDVFVNYTDKNGTVHEKLQTESLSSDQKVGDHVAILYDEADSSVIEPNPMDRYAFYVYAVGGILVIVGIVRIATGAKEDSNNSFGKLY